MKRLVPTRLRYPLLAAGLLLAGVFWWTLAPSQIGGRAVYVSTHGVSMLPGIRTGDLVVVHEGGPYRVGDVVAYRNRLLHSDVLHRIVRIEGGHYVFKGDNNSWLDPAPATPDELIGRMWLHVPHGRTVLAWPLAPLHMAVVLAVLAAAYLLATGEARRRRARRGDSPELGEAPHRLPDLRVLLLPAGCVLAVGAVVLAVGALSPSRHPAKRTVPYTQSGRFSYSAAVRTPTSALAPVAVTGEPVFTRLSDRVRLAFAYRIASQGRLAAGGTLALAVRLHDASGWTKTVPVAPPTRFEGTTSGVHGSVSLRRLWAVVAALDDATGVPRSNVLVDVLPTVRTAGTLEGRPFSTSFAPALTLSLDEHQLSLAETGGTAAAALAPAAGGSVQTTASVPSPIRLAGFSASPAGVEDAGRWIVLAGAVLLALGMLSPRLRQRPDPAGELLERHGDRILTVVSAGDPFYTDVVEVPDFDALVRVSEHYRRMILHTRHASEDVFAVAEDGIAYLYRVQRDVAVAPGLALLPPPPPEPPGYEEPEDQLGPPAPVFRRVA